MEAWLGPALSRIDPQANRECRSPRFLIGVNQRIGWSTEGEKDGVKKGTDKNAMRNQTMATFISGCDENANVHGGVV